MPLIQMVTEFAFSGQRAPQHRATARPNSACTGQGAEKWPFVRRGQSLRRALQVKPSVRQVFEEGDDGRVGHISRLGAEMQNYNFVVERDADTGLYVGHIPGWPGAHSQGETLDELQGNLQEVVAMLLEDGAPRLESEFVGMPTDKVPEVCPSAFVGGAVVEGALAADPGCCAGVEAG